MKQNFDKRGTEFTKWIPDDWEESPKYLSKVKDTNFRWFGGELNKLWQILGRKMKDEVAVSYFRSVPIHIHTLDVIRFELSNLMKRLV